MSNQTIKEQIITTVKEAIDGIKQINGFDNDINFVERWQQAGNSKAVTPAAFIHTGNEEKELRPSFVTACNLTMYIDVWTVHDTTKFTGSTDELLNTFANDIEKAVMEDMQRCNLAERTSVTSIDLFETVEGQPFCGVIATLEIKYRHKTGDPKTLV